jgi:ABC-type antimicrobial peptide transport system permease subunit
MKAIGYKNTQIFVGLCYEQLYLTLKGFIFGGTFSAILIAVTNYIFRHKSYMNMIYIIDWKLFFTYLGISLAIAIIIPLLCQIVLLKKLKKIQPKDAMSAD